MLHLRHPFQIGGLYFTLNLVMSQASVVVCAYLYVAYYQEEDTNGTQSDSAALHNVTVANSTATKFTEEQLQMSVGTLFAVFVVSSGLFIAKMDHRFVKTFFSTETGHAWAKRFFLEGEDDFIKSQVLTCNQYQWTSIRPQVAEWLDANWDKWERDKPDWFNDLFVDSVDDDIMPARVLARLKQEAEGGERRRSSFMERVSVREKGAGEG